MNEGSGAIEENAASNNTKSPEADAAVKRLNQELVVAGYSPRTIKMYCIYLREFLGNVKKRPEEISREDIVGFLAGKKSNENVSNATLALVHSSLKFYFHNVLRRKIIEEIKVPKNGKPISTDTIQRMIRETAKKAGIQKEVTPHKLRHSYATHLLEAGENIRKIQELLGHSNLNTTQIYTQVSTQELKKVVSPLDRLRGRPRAP